VSTPTESPQPITEATESPRTCPRCGAAMTEEQEWCLRCGAAVGTRIATAQGWRVPLVLTGLLVVLAAVAIAIAIIQLADDTDEVPADASVTPTPSAVQTPPPTPSATPPPPPTSTPDSGGSVAEWPAGTDGWTVVLASKSSEDAARDSAESFSSEGIPDVGILNSDDFNSLKSGFWVVYSGEFDSQAEAAEALDDVDAPDAYIRRIADD